MDRETLGEAQYDIENLARSGMCQRALDRLSLLQLAQSLGNVSLACSMRGVSRTSYYEWLRRYSEYGLEGLRDRPSVHRYHPQTTPPDTAARILSESLAHPAWGCVRISRYLKTEGISVASPTIQKILIRNDLGTTGQRVRHLEKQAILHDFLLGEEQIRCIEKDNPCFRERASWPSYPGEQIIIGSMCLARYYAGAVRYLHLAIDSNCVFAFSWLSVNKAPEDAIALLENEVFPFYASRRIRIRSVVTGKCREYVGSKTHPFHQYLAQRGIRHKLGGRRITVQNGYLRYYLDVFRKEFLRTSSAPPCDEVLSVSSQRIREWVDHYNYVRRQPGFPNFGVGPSESMKSALMRANPVQKTFP